MKRFALALALTACASSGTTSTIVTEPEPPLPNSTPQTALPLPIGLEVTGQLGCGQVAWYQIILPDTRPLTMNVFGQALENALGATATLAFVEPSGVELGRLMLPVFARSPNWDPREQHFIAPHPGTFFARVTLDANGCQRVAYRLTLH